MASSYDLASSETRKAYNSMVQYVRTVLGKFFPPKDLMSKEGEVLKQAKDLAVFTVMRTSPGQVVSPDWFLKILGLAVGNSAVSTTS